ncbi:phage integrase N-terminal SAM-like domain-containing protein [Nostoc sp.]|uniref:phage integrase N-terminal SAM-like domain-containing protein n=1 Tax=Nostoc sp. TaxID=1180 RepID=UPI003FA5D18B
MEAFLTHLVVNENMAASTQNQTLHAVLFLYREVLKQDLDLRDAFLKTRYIASLRLNQ